MFNLDYEGNPIKEQGDKYLVPNLAQTMKRWTKEDQPTNNKLPVVTDVPAFLFDLGVANDATEVV